MSLIKKCKSSLNLKHSYYYKVFLIGFFASCIFKNIDLYLFVNNMISLSIILGVAYIIYIRRRFVEKTFFKNINFKYINLLEIAIINLSGFIFIIYGNIIEYIIYLISIELTLEYFQININFNLTEKFNIIKRIFYIYIIGILALMIYPHLGHNTFFNRENNYYVILLSASISVSCFFLCFTLKSLYDYVGEINKSDLDKICIYVSSLVFMTVGVLFFKDSIIGCMIVVFKTASFYDFYNYIMKKELNSALNIINNDISKTANTKRDFNHMLKKRNLILNDTNIMIERAQDKYRELIDFAYGGIFVFYNDKLEYANDNSGTIFNENANDILGIKLSDFIHDSFNTTKSSIVENDNCLSNVLTSDNRIVDISLTQAEDDISILYVHDNIENIENMEAKKELEECLEEDELKKEFFANISHELKTPINLVSTALQLNPMYLEQGNFEAFDRNRSRIKQNCLRLIRTINNFIDANKVSEGYIIPTYGIYNIVELVENVSMGCNKYISLMDNTLVFDSDEEEIYVKCDKDMIIRIVLNILSNSVKYSKKDGTIEVFIESDKSDKVTIKVKNDGMKIEKETIPYIFDKFTKINKAFNRLKEGSGLGLFLTKALIELQGGSISLVTNNEGNEFCIEFDKLDNSYYNDEDYENLEMNALEEKIDIEFSDIYID